MPILHFKLEERKYSFGIIYDRTTVRCALSNDEMRRSSSDFY